MDKGRSFGSEEELWEKRKKKGALPLAVFLSFNDRDVHPHCPNATNPFHKCGRHCLDKIPSNKLLDGEKSWGSGAEREKVSDRRGVNPSCPNTSNPFHKCAHYCFEKMSDNCRDVRKEPEKDKGALTVAEKHDVNPNSKLAFFEDTLKKGYPVEGMKTMEEKMLCRAEEQFDSEWKNTSNCFHVCDEYCFEKASERDNPGRVAKLKKLEKKNAFRNGEITGVNPRCKYASNPFHRCAEYCFQKVAKKNISEGVLIKVEKVVEENMLVLTDVQSIRISVSDLFHEWAKYCSLKASEEDIK